MLSLVLLAGLLSSFPGLAADRLYRMVDSGDGLPVSHVDSLAEDVDGFIWVGTAAGLARLDGSRVEPWGSDRLRLPIYRISTGPGSGQVAVEAQGQAWAVVDRSVERLGVAGGTFQAVRDVAFAADGALWVADGSGLWRGAQDAWTRPLEGGPLDRQVKRLQRDGEALLLMTDDAVWSLPLAGPPRRLLSADRPHTVVRLPAGDLLVQQRMGPVLRVSASGVEPLPLERPYRAMDMLLRGDTLWTSFDVGLYAWTEGQEPELLGPDQGVWSGGPLLVDHEGSLWLGTFRGLMILPEPGTVTWTVRDGLPSSHTRSIALTGERLWVTTWQGMGWVDWGDRPTAGSSQSVQLKSRVCSDAFGRAWATGFLAGDGGADVIGRLDEAGVEVYRFPGARAWTASCALRPDGSLWFAMDLGLFATPRGEGPPLRVAPLPGRGGPGPHAVLEDDSGRLWVSSGGELCSTTALEALADPGVWTCEDFDSSYIAGLAQLPSGALWVAVRHDGIFRSTPTGWERIPGADALASHWYEELVPSPRGGVWITTQEGLVRVLERPELAAGWEEVERLPGWEAALMGNATDVVEQQDGTLWVASNAGVTRVPPVARDAAPSLPQPRIIESRLDGVASATSGIVEAARPGSSLDLRLAALSYRDPQHLGFRLRLGPEDPWVSTGREGALHLVSLPPGRHGLELSASLDGLHWSEAERLMVVVVPQPWYRRPAVLAGFALVLLSVGLVIHQVRLRSLLRLEQLRTRVAMDLHDELGSGLGSIGLLAGLIGSGSLEAAAVPELSVRIGTVARELSAALSGIVWSLGDNARSLDGLARHLTERAERLFPGVSGETDLVTRFPSPLPTEALSLPVARAVERIAMEALHNAARHAEASRVELGLSRAGRRWRVWVADDGTGPGEGARPGGLGRRSMARRAEEIHAELSWGPGEPRGTRVEVIFAPDFT